MGEHRLSAYRVLRPVDGPDDLSGRGVPQPEIVLATGQRGARGRPGHPGHLAGAHLQNRHREAVDVRTPAQRFTGRLLGRGIPRGHPTAARHQDASAGWHVRTERGRQLPSLRQAEVGDLRSDRAVLAALGIEQHVGRFDVQVHHATAVRMIETPRDLDRDVQDPRQHLERPTRIQPPVTDPLMQTAARDVLGEHPRHTLEQTDVIAAAHIWMQTQRHPRLRLRYEQPLILRTTKQVRSRTLDRKVDAPHQVPNPVHHPHTALLVHPGHRVPAVDHLADSPVGRGLTPGHGCPRATPAAPTL